VLLHETFERTRDRLPEKIALVADGERLSYRALDERIARLACSLQAEGVRRGDRVALVLPNGVEMVVGLYAALRVGAVAMPVNPQTKAHKLAYMLNDATPVCLFADANSGLAWRQALEMTSAVRTVIVTGGESKRAEGNRHLLSFAEAVSGGSGTVVDPGTIDVDLAAIIYTSGSTGDPKGVMLTHLNMVSANRSISTYLGLREDDRIFCALPLSFDYGLYQILMGFTVGATVVLELSFAFPAKCLERMDREEITVFPGVPTLFTLLMGLENVREFGLARLRTITNTAAALSERHIRELRELFPQARLFSMYGLTECKRVTYLPPEQLDVRPTSVGRGMPNEEVYLVDEQGHRLPNGATGELVIRGSNVMRGYWNKPAETAERLRPGPYPGEMVLHSGDLFRTDEEGYLYFVARKDDIIKSRGEKVSPREVENAIHALDAVQDAAVIGVPDEVLGEAVKAYVILRPDHRMTERDVVKHCATRLENFMVPKFVEFVAELPTSHNGKIRKTQLKAGAPGDTE
jgi:long-chain acyl-CoA synthetase